MRNNLEIKKEDINHMNQLIVSMRKKQKPDKKEFAHNKIDERNIKLNVK